MLACSSKRLWLGAPEQYSMMSMICLHICGVNILGYRPSISWPCASGGIVLKIKKHWVTVSTELEVMAKGRSAASYWAGSHGKRPISCVQEPYGLKASADHSPNLCHNGLLPSCWSGGDTPLEQKPVCPIDPVHFQRWTLNLFKSIKRNASPERPKSIQIRSIWSIFGVRGPTGPKRRQTLDFKLTQIH